MRIKATAEKEKREKRGGAPRTSRSLPSPKREEKKKGTPSTAAMPALSEKKEKEPRTYRRQFARIGEEKRGGGHGQQDSYAWRCMGKRNRGEKE